MELHDDHYTYKVDAAEVTGTSVVGRITDANHPDPRMVGSVVKRVDEAELNMLRALGPQIVPQILQEAVSTGGCIPAGGTFILMPYVGPDLGSLCRDIEDGGAQTQRSDEIDQLVEDLLEALEDLEEAGIECTHLRAEHVLMTRYDPYSSIRFCGFGGATQSGENPGREHLRLWAEMLQAVLPTLAGAVPPGNNPEALRRAMSACLTENPLDRPEGAGAALDLVKMPVEPVAPAIPPRPSSPTAPTVFEQIGDWLNRTEAQRGRRLDPHLLILIVCLGFGVFAGMTIMSAILGR